MGGRPGLCILDEVEEFLTGVRPLREIDRVLATVLFTDIVGSTEHIARVGDKAGGATGWIAIMPSCGASSHRSVAGRSMLRATVFSRHSTAQARAVRCALNIQGCGTADRGIDIVQACTRAR